MTLPLQIWRIWRPAGRAGLQVPGAQAHRQIRDEGILRLPGAVRHEDAPPGQPQQVVLKQRNVVKLSELSNIIWYNYKQTD